MKPMITFNDVKTIMEWCEKHGNSLQNIYETYLNSKHYKKPTITFYILKSLMSDFRAMLDELKLFPINMTNNINGFANAVTFRINCTKKEDINHYITTMNDKYLKFWEKDDEK